MQQEKDGVDIVEAEKAEIKKMCRWKPKFVVEDAPPLDPDVQRRVKEREEERRQKEEEPFFLLLVFSFLLLVFPSLFFLLRLPRNRLLYLALVIVDGEQSKILTLKTGIFVLLWNDCVGIECLCWNIECLFSY